MKKALTLITAVALASASQAQVLNEPFDTSTSGVFPPAGWTETNSGTPEIWVDTVGAAIFAIPAGFPTADAAGHAYTGFGNFADSNLMSPIMDLSSFGAPELTYDGGLGYSNYMSHTSIYFGLSDIEVSTDGGVTFASAWAEAAVADYWTPAITLDLTGSAANQASVGINFRYQGEFAHEWVVDNVIVDNVGPSGPGLAVSGSCPGVMSLDASGMTAGGPVVFAYSIGGGSVTIAGGPCAGLTLAMGAPVQLGIVVADGSGNASFSGNAPANACGVVLVVAVDGATCTGSNIVGI